MARTYPIQSRFTLGEMSPRLHKQLDSQAYGSGLAECTNMTVTQQGSCKRRGGLELINTYPGTFARVFSFQLTPQSVLGRSFPIVVSNNGKMYVEGATGSVSGPIINTNPSFNSGISGWSITTSSTDASVIFYTGYVQILASSTDGVWDGITQAVSISPDDYNKNHFIYADVSTEPGAFINPDTRIRVGTTPGGNELGFTPSGSSYIFNPLTNSTVYITVEAEGGTYETISPPGEPPTIGSNKVYIYDVSVRGPAVSTGNLIFDHPWSEDDIRNMQVKMPPISDAIYFVTPKVAPHKLSLDAALDDWTFDPVTFSGLPPEWSGDSWPSCLCFFQGRSWWAGVEKSPETIWASQSNSFERLVPGTAADSGLKFTNAARGKIEWIEGARQLIFGTPYAEYIVSSSSGIITPDDIFIEPQSTDGGVNIQPIPVGASALFVSADRKKIHSASYVRDSEQWITRDNLFSAEHLTENSDILEFTYCRNPDSLIWVVLSDGSMLSATVYGLNEPFGWHKHNTQGEVLSITAIQEDGKSALYAIVLRTRSGGPVLCLEKLSSGYFLDSFVLSENPAPVSEVVGLEHLEGRQVIVVADGGYVGTKTVTGGSVDLVDNYTTILVGLDQVSRIKTLEMDTIIQNGSTVDFNKRTHAISLHVIRSAHPSVNGVTTPNRSPQTPMDEVQPLVSGSIRYNSTKDNSGSIEIESIYPYELHIIAISGIMEASVL